MELHELVQHLNSNSNLWPDSSHADIEGKLAEAAETRMLKVIGDHRVIWAHGFSTVLETGSIELSAVVFTEGYVVADTVRSITGHQLPRGGATRVIPWTELTGLTMREYWPAGLGGAVEHAGFTVHMGDGADFHVMHRAMQAQPNAFELLGVVLEKLAAKQ